MPKITRLDQLSQKYINLLREIERQQPTDTTRLAKALDTWPNAIHAQVFQVLYRFGLVDSQTERAHDVRVITAEYTRPRRRMAGTIRLTKAGEEFLGGVESETNTTRRAGHDPRGPGDDK